MCKALKWLWVYVCVWYGDDDNKNDDTFNKSTHTTTQNTNFVPVEETTVATLQFSFISLRFIRSPFRLLYFFARLAPQQRNKNRLTVK